MNESNEDREPKKLFNFERFNFSLEIFQRKKVNHVARAIFLNATLIRKLHAISDCLEEKIEEKIEEEIEEKAKEKSKSKRQKKEKTEEEKEEQKQKQKQKRIRTAFQEDDLGNNVAIAYLKNKELTKHYFANSVINIPNDIDENSTLEINKIATICYIDAVHQELPVRRLDVKNLKFYEPSFKGYAGTKQACCERKILAKILQEAKENQGVKALKRSELHLYTKLEPCIYCFMAMKQFIKENKIDLYLYYGDLQKELFEQMRNSIPHAQLMIDRLTLVRGKEIKQQEERWLLRRK
ncbi:hypothetical protein [Priestia megaterium]|uniref:hypothetical protein n=1 Tax=Priestia megaterium TaxID=1404 RepID=UPI00177F521A|nr:hypothetical protein [Priestia megaterium]MBD8847064.1 hypothetical protein [Priestia megaterium]